MALLQICIFLTFLLLHVNGSTQPVISIRRMRKSTSPPIMEWFTWSNGTDLQINLTGPADRWFGFGIGNSTMDNTYAIVISPDGNLTEHILGNHNPGMVLPTSQTDLSYTSTVVEYGTDDEFTHYRYVTITRNRVGYSNLFYTFPAVATSEVNLIAAWGSSSGDTFGTYHGDGNYEQKTVDFLLYNDSTSDPTNAPTLAPTDSPTYSPTLAPTDSPTLAPTQAPTHSPTISFENRYDAWGYVVMGDGYSEDQLDRIELVVGIEYDTETVFINMTGPTGQWFAVGFSDTILPTAQYGMENNYAIVVDWRREGKYEITDEMVHEYYLGDHYVNLNDELDKFVEVKTQYEQIQFRRNVLVERPRQTTDKDTDYHIFDKCPRQYNLVWSRGMYSPTSQSFFEDEGGHTIFSRGLGQINIVFNEGEQWDEMREECSGAMSLSNGMLMSILMIVAVIVCVF